MAKARKVRPLKTVVATARSDVSRPMTTVAGRG